MGHIAPPRSAKPATANNNLGGDALEEDQNHDIVACCLPGHAKIPHTLCKELKIINLAAYITNLLFLKTKKARQHGETKLMKFACL
jgi:hypothetical protein